MTEPSAETGPLRETDTTALPLRLRELSNKVVTRFHLTPTPEARAALAQELSIPKIRKLDFRGTIRAEGKHDWRLDGVLGATVVQDCVVTAEPVTTRIDTPVLRVYVRDWDTPTEAETEIPDDDTREELGSIIDPGVVMAEALALSLPDYPRADGAELPDSAKDQMVDERPNPFAALAALKTKPEDEA
ncbi:DUF177 domain-containing protein [Pararhodobacter sp. CCB-MM2]|uniref:YceD family protein n=1 Tax=Pararhodobacter sp. CCB-MM2 TaxID=1786003 RepID=UPI00082D6936|nr:DUF177 domain-containing protein [Pararhodobacter sp. CCB-MM2]